MVEGLSPNGKMAARRRLKAGHDHRRRGGEVARCTRGSSVPRAARTSPAATLAIAMCNSTVPVVGCPTAAAPASSAESGVPSARNNRIMVVDFLIRFCRFGARFESILLEAPAKSLLNSIGKKPEWRPLFGVSSLKRFSHNHDPGQPSH